MEVRAAFLGLILLVSSVPSAVLADVPRSFEVEELNRRISHGRLVQVHTHAGRFQTEDATARPDGINYRGIVTSTIRDTLPVPGLVSWDQIKQVDVRGSSCGVGAAYGAVIGAAALGTIAGVYGPMENRDAKSTAGAALGGALLGAGIGAVVGAGVGLVIPKWHTAYRAEHQAR
jgi:hypothetical protein